MARRRARRLASSRNPSPGPSRHPSRPPTPHHNLLTTDSPAPLVPATSPAKFVIKTEPDEVDGPALLRSALAKASPTTSLSPTPSHSPVHTPSRTPTLVSQLAPVLSCTKCGVLLREPTTLACGHAVCLACVSPPPSGYSLRGGLTRSTTGPSSTRLPPSLNRSGSGTLSGPWLSFSGGPTPSPPALQNIPFDLPTMPPPPSHSCDRPECRTKKFKQIEHKVDFTLQKIVALVRDVNGPDGAHDGEWPAPFPRTTNPAKAAPVTPKLDSADVHSALECAVCFQLLTDPATSPCGHTYCGVCLLRAHDHAAVCPLCRADLPIGGGGGRPNLTLQSVLDVVFEGEMIERKKQMEDEASVDGYPLFVCTLSWVSVSL